MNSRRLGALVAGTFALGILAGSAGTIVLREATAPSADAVTTSGSVADMGRVMAMMGGSSMPMTGGSSMPMMPHTSAMPGPWHQSHHPQPDR